MIAEFLFVALETPTLKHDVYKIHKDNGYYFVLVSQINEPSFFVKETYIFLCDKTGHVAKYNELLGSCKDIKTSEEVLTAHGCSFIL